MEINLHYVYTGVVCKKNYGSNFEQSILKKSMQTVIFQYFWVLIDMPPAVYKYKFIVDMGGGGGRGLAGRRGCPLTSP